MNHDVTIREEVAGIHVVQCSCGYSVGAPFGEWQAAKIVDRHLSKAGYRPTPRGSIYG